MSEVLIIIPAIVASVASIISFYSAYRSRGAMESSVESLNHIIAHMNAMPESNSSRLSYLEIYKALDELDEAVLQVGHSIIIKTVSDKDEQRVYNFEVSEQEKNQFEEYFTKEKSIPKLIDYLILSDSTSRAEHTSKEAKLFLPVATGLADARGT